MRTTIASDPTLLKKATVGSSVIVSPVPAEFWLDARFPNGQGGTSPTNGDVLTVWKNLAGSSWDFVPWQAGAGGVYRTGVLAGGPAIQFTGTQGFVNSSMLLRNSGSIFVVAQPTSTTGKGTICKVGGVTDGYGVGFGTTDYDTAGANVVTLCEGQGWAASTWPNAANMPIALVVEAINGGKVWRTSKATTPQYTDDQLMTNFANSNAATINVAVGCASSTGNRPLTAGYIGLVMGFQHILTSAERAALYTWASAGWDIKP